MLEMSGLTCTYNRVIQALSGVSLSVKPGQIVGLLGPNGAGKTTTLRCITGEIRFLNGEIVEGTIEFKGKTIRHLQPFQVTKLGISSVPEDRKLFIDMTLDDNLMMGAYQIRDKRIVKENYEKIFDYFPILKAIRRRLAGYLSGGEQQMLAIARALMSSPELLLLDEPSTGLAPKVVSDIFGIIEKIRREDKTPILLVEQNANMALRISDSCFILEKGTIVINGESSKLKNDPKIKSVYLGIH
jgi:branched-chain amino acid transport system ATP-binding protein